MARIMALDVGDKTIGIAFSDETGSMAFPGETIVRGDGYRRDMAALRGLIADREVGRIVVGLPLLADGSHGPQADRVEAFVARLRNSVRIAIDWQDEAYTTVGADAILDELKRPREGRKRTIDSIAACLILQDYLAALKDSRAQTDASTRVGAKEIGPAGPGLETD